MLQRHMPSFAEWRNSSIWIFGIFFWNKMIFLNSSMIQQLCMISHEKIHASWRNKWNDRLTHSALTSNLSNLELEASVKTRKGEKKTTHTSNCFGPFSCPLFYDLERNENEKKKTDSENIFVPIEFCVSPIYRTWESDICTF